MRLREKVIIVAGSTSGIGRAIVELAVQEGARVLVHGLDEAQGLELTGRLGAAAAWCRADLADPAAPARIADAARRAFGRIDGVVNNAAAVVRSNLGTTTAAFFDSVMAVNVRAPLLLIQAALPDLRERRGRVLNIGSINALSGEPELLDYAVSKGALQTLTRNLASALAGEGVRVNQINPGWVLTPAEYALQRRLGQPEDWPQRVPAQYAPSGRLLRPEEVAAAAIYWLGDESGPVSGSVVELEQYSLIGRNPAKV